MIRDTERIFNNATWFKVEFKEIVELSRTTFCLILVIRHHIFKTWFWILMIRITSCNQFEQPRIFFRLLLTSLSLTRLIDINSTFVRSNPMTTKNFSFRSCHSPWTFWLTEFHDFTFSSTYSAVFIVKNSINRISPTLQQKSTRCPSVSD